MAKKKASAENFKMAAVIRDMLTENRKLSKAESPQIVVDSSGLVRFVYDETVDLQTLGPFAIRRASQVEPTADGQWTADLAPVGGPCLGLFPHRSEALAAEREWLLRHWLVLT